MSAGLLYGAPRDPITTARPSLVGHRFREKVRVDLLDRRDRSIGKLTTATSGSIDLNVAGEIRGGGSVEVEDPQLVDWLQVRLQPWYVFTDEAGAVHEHPLGVYIPAASETQHRESGRSASVELYDKTQLLVDDQVPETWTVDKGTTVVDAVTALLDSIDETRISAPDDSETLKSSMVWEPGTTKLRIINDILEAGNYFSIWVDGYGTWHLVPYIEPTRRPVQWHFVAGTSAIFLNQIDHDADYFSVRNQMILIGRAEDDGETPAPFAVAENNDPDDPLSIPNRGVKSMREDDQDATSLDVLGQIAARRLLEVSAVTSSYEIQHVWVPMDINAAAILQVPEHGVDALCVLRKWSWSWDAATSGWLTSATLREVAR